MLLALSIISEQGSALGPAAYKVFDERGGSIGRVAGNDWVLPDPHNFVSSRHALVSASGGMFYLEDRSSNGTFVNSPDQPASRTAPHLLQDGDRLFIGDYEIIVQLIPSAPAEMATRAPAQSATVVTAMMPAPAAPDLHHTPPPPPPSGLGLGTVDPLAALGGAAPGGSAASGAGASAGAGTAQAVVNPLLVLAVDATLHQAAVLAGIRAGFNAVLATLHPEKLEESFERKLKRTAMIGLGNKARYWEMYRAQFEEIDRDREAHFQTLFGEQFALAYNEHLQKLAADARLRKPRP
jgi:predicted component of type VI protein secretion system